MPNYLPMLDSEADKAKFARLYQQYVRLMFSVASRLLRESADAEDAVHQAFLTVIQDLDRVREVDSPETRSFLVIVTERKAIDILRERRNVRNAGLMEELVRVEAPLPGETGLTEALSRLPARYREVLLLRYDDGVRTRDIARLLGLKMDTAQKLIWRAREALKRELAAENAPEP